MSIKTRDERMFISPKGTQVGEPILTTMKKYLELLLKGLMMKSEDEEWVMEYRRLYLNTIEECPLREKINNKGSQRLQFSFPK